MKFLKCIFFIICTNFLSININAQIKLESNGNLTLWGSHWTGGVKFVNYNYNNQYFVGIYPAQDWGSVLGIATNRFAFAYIDYVDYDLDENLLEYNKFNLF